MCASTSQFHCADSMRFHCTRQPLCKVVILRTSGCPKDLNVDLRSALLVWAKSCRLTLHCYSPKPIPTSMRLPIQSSVGLHLEVLIYASGLLTGLRNSHIYRRCFLRSVRAALCPGTSRLPPGQSPRLLERRNPRHVSSSPKKTPPLIFRKPPTR